jgi:cold shock CspA family protein
VGLVGETGRALPDSREVMPVSQQSGTVRSLNATFTEGYLSDDQNSGAFVQFESNQVEGLRSLSVGERVSFDVVEDATEPDQQGHAENIQREAGDLEAYQDQGGLYS